MDDHKQVFINVYCMHKYHIHDKYMNRSYGEFEFFKNGRKMTQNYTFKSCLETGPSIRISPLNIYFTWYFTNCLNGLLILFFFPDNVDPIDIYTEHTIMKWYSS